MINNDKIKMVTKQFKQRVEKKYDVVEMKLFGSSARKESSQNSDNDIMASCHT